MIIHIIKYLNIRIYKIFDLNLERMNELYDVLICIMIG